MAVRQKIFPLNGINRIVRLENARNFPSYITQSLRRNAIFMCQRLFGKLIEWKRLYFYRMPRNIVMSTYRDCHDTKISFIPLTRFTRINLCCPFMRQGDRAFSIVFSSFSVFHLIFRTAKCVGIRDIS